MPRSGEEIERALRELVKKWGSFGGTEKSASQTFLNQLIECYSGTKDVFEAGARFEEFGATDEGSGYMDLYWPDVVIIEMKRPAETSRLDAHRRQALDYWRNSADVLEDRAAPRFLVLCSFRRFEVWEPGRFPREPVDSFDLAELPDRYEALMFLAGDEPIFGGPGQQLTREAAECMAQLYFHLVDRLADEPNVLRDFVLQSVWCLFAEDLHMLTGQPLQRIVDALLHDAGRNRSSAAELGHLFTVLNLDERIGRGGIYAGAPYANGGLFARPARVHLDHEELGLLAKAASYDWRQVDPTIFGSLMEDCLGREHRWELGAHYTHESDIMRIVRPTIVEPWEARLAACESPADAERTLADLCKFRVLDPACGCGNFLYVAYRELRALEARAKLLIEDLARRSGGTPPDPRSLPGYAINNIHGIEIEEFAVLITRVTLWMGHKLGADRFGPVEPVLPLIDLGNIRRADTLRQPWPEVDAIIGNPPFHGTKQLRSELGDEYASWLVKEFGIGIKDYCVYWFRKAHDHLRIQQRAGLVATNSIGEGRIAKPASTTSSRMVESSPTRYRARLGRATRLCLSALSTGSRDNRSRPMSFASMVSASMASRLRSCPVANYLPPLISLRTKDASSSASSRVEMASCSPRVRHKLFFRRPKLTIATWSGHT